MQTQLDLNTESGKYWNEKLSESFHVNRTELSMECEQEASNVKKRKIKEIEKTSEIKKENANGKNIKTQSENDKKVRRMRIKESDRKR